MNIVEFLKTVYLGDRACKAVLIDGWNSEVKLQVDCISRVRGAAWNYYDAEDLIDGLIVFERVRSIAFEPPGVMPNDSINDIRVEALTGNQSQYLIVVSLDAVDEEGTHTEVEIRIHADSMALEAALKPGERITE